MRYAVFTMAAAYFLCLLGGPRAFAADVTYTPDGRAVAAVEHQETNPTPGVPELDFLGPPSLFEDSPLKPVDKSERKMSEPEKLTPDEIQQIEKILEEIDQIARDFQPAVERIEKSMSRDESFSMMPELNGERKSSSLSAYDRELKMETREEPLGDSAQRFPSLTQISEQNQHVADLTGVGETQFSFPAFEVFISAAVHFFRAKVSSVKDKLEEESFQPFDLATIPNSGTNALLPDSLNPNQANAEVLASVTLDETIAAIHYFLNPPQGAHPLHRILFYLSHVDSDDLRHYENTRRKIEEINRVAKAEELKVRYMGRVFDAGFIPLLDDAREARLELLAKK